MFEACRLLHWFVALSAFHSTVNSDSLRGLPISESNIDPEALLNLLDTQVSIRFDDATLSYSEEDAQFQPEIRYIETQPQRMVYDSISSAEGTPWCGGNATIWLVGHQLDETPHCYNAETDEWTTPRIAMMTNRDALNDLDGKPPNIDRHGCTFFDVNKDGLPDIVCGVGANKGEGFGYTELYFTQEDGSIKKYLEHGLQKYPTVRARYVKSIHNTVENVTHVVISAFGTGRADGEVNYHTLYRHIEGPPFFEEVRGPWNKNAKTTSVTVADWNDDGRDDFIIFHNRNWTMFLEQEEGGTFREINYPRTYRSKRMRSARVVDINDDGIKDLIVTTSAYQTFGKKKLKVGPKLKIFLGVDGPERFDFTESYFYANLQYSAPDVEVMDVNSDGIPDLYVVQNDDMSDSFCSKPMPWRIRPYPPYEWVAPSDLANDLLFMGMEYTDKKLKRFDKVVMEHVLPGCGYIARRFGDDRTMILANGDEGHAGSSAILKW